jgi:D-sedoheptulose 7-phosphate isomerase
MINATLQQQLIDHNNIIESTVSENSQLIEKLALVIADCFRRGNKLLLCGNGGSAADAQHIAAEFINRFRLDRRPLPAIALTTDSSVLTSISNDSAFENIFSRQVDALGLKDDILLVITTSGGSRNVINALDISRLKNMITICFTGKNGREIMKEKCDYSLVVSSSDTARIQECHEFVFHVVCGLVETQLFNNPK